METIRVLIAAAPTIAGEILHAAAGKDTRLKLLPDVSDLSELETALAAQDVHVVIVGLEGESLPRGYEDLVKRYPDLRVLGLSEDGRQAFAFDLRMVPRPLGPASVPALLQAVQAPSNWH